jgi:hypothetical protein
MVCVNQPSDRAATGTGIVYTYNVQIYNSRSKYNNIGIVASVMLTWSSLQLTDTPLLTTCVVTRIMTSNTDVSNTEESTTYTVSCAERAVYKWLPAQRTTE